MTFLTIGLVSAIYDVNAEPVKGDVVATKMASDGVHEPMLLQNGSGEGKAIATSIGSPRARIQGEGQFMLENGKTLRFSEEGEQLRLQTGEHTAECKGCNLTQEDGRIKAMMSNGINAEIKIMPDQANERALERLRLRICDDCSIELKEVGSGDKARMAYEVKTQKKAKLFGIFGANMKVEAQIDAENGEVIKSKKPWWAFLASEEDETEAE